MLRGSSSACERRNDPAPLWKASLFPIGAWQEVHFVSITDCKAGFSTLSAVTFACHSGSFAALAIIVLRQSVIGEISLPVLVTSVPLPEIWQLSQIPDPEKSVEVSVGSGVCANRNAPHMRTMVSVKLFMRLRFDKDTCFI